MDLLHDKLFSNGDASNAIPCGEYPIREEKGKDVCNGQTQMCTSFYIEGITSDNNYNCKLSNSKCIKGDRCQLPQCNKKNVAPYECATYLKKDLESTCSDYYIKSGQKSYNCLLAYGRCQPSQICEFNHDNGIEYVNVDA